MNGRRAKTGPLAADGSGLPAGQATSRRTAVLGVGGLLGAGLFSRDVFAATRPLTLEQRLLAIFADGEAARRIGRACLQAGACGMNRAELLALLLEDEYGRPLPTASLAAADLHAALRDRLRRDFAAGRTVWVEGWLLAETEARLFALAALA